MSYARSMAGSASILIRRGRIISPSDGIDRLGSIARKDMRSEKQQPRWGGRLRLEDHSLAAGGEFEDGLGLEQSGFAWERVKCMYVQLAVPAFVVDERERLQITRRPFRKLAENTPF